MLRPPVVRLYAGLGGPMAASSRARYRDALRHRDFRLLTSAFVVNQVGGWAHSVVLAVYLFDRTGSTTVLACSWSPVSG